MMHYILYHNKINLCINILCFYIIMPYIYFFLIFLAYSKLIIFCTLTLYIFKELPQDDPLQRKPDITLANEVLNWRPEISLNEGLNKTITYFKENLKI